MKLNLEYSVQVENIDEDDAPKLERALLEAAKAFDAKANVEEIDSEEVED